MIYCLNCGKGIPDDSKFCTFCGAAVAVVDPQHPNLASTSSQKTVDVSRNYTTTKTVNEFYKDAGFWGSIIVLAGFFLPFDVNGDSLFNAVQANASSQPAVLIWLIFPVSALMVLLHSLIPGWPAFISTIFIILVIIALGLFVYVFVKDPITYFGSDDISTILKTAGVGMWATLLGTILLLFHRRHKKVEVQKTKIIDRTA